MIFQAEFFKGLKTDNVSKYVSIKDPNTHAIRNPNKDHLLISHAAKIMNPSSVGWFLVV
jgi:hypothetical protein